MTVKAGKSRHPAMAKDHTACRQDALAFVRMSASNEATMSKPAERKLQSVRNSIMERISQWMVSWQRAFLRRRHR